MLDQTSPIKISVIVPVYNTEPYLEQCLNSVLEQDLKEIEVICVNDGSTDQSLRILKDYSDKDDRVIIIDQENQGLSGARNSGIDKSRGEYLYFLDSDDWLERGALNKLYVCAKNNDAEVVFCDRKVFYEDLNTTLLDSLNKRSHKRLLTESDSIKILKKDFIEIFNQISSSMCNKLLKATFIKNNELYFFGRIAEDALLTFKLLVLCKSLIYCPIFAFNYRQRGNSTLHHENPNMLSVFDVTNNLAEFLKQRDLYQSYSKELEWFEYYLADWCFPRIPYRLRGEFLKKAKDNLTEKYYKLLTRKGDIRRSPLEKILSLKNFWIYSQKYKVLTVLGFTFYIKAKSRKEVAVYEQEYQIYPVDFANRKAIVFSLDETSFPIFVSNFNSLIFKLSSEKIYDIVVLGDKVTTQMKQAIESLMPNNVNLRFISVDRYLRSRFMPMRLRGKRPPFGASFYLLFIPFLFGCYEKVLYLDRDAGIKKSPDELFDIDMENKPIGAQPEVNIDIWKKTQTKRSNFLRRVLKADPVNYFSKSVILFNIPKINLPEYLQRLCCAGGGSIDITEQDVLNYCFKEEWLRLN